QGRQLGERVLLHQLEVRPGGRDHRAHAGETINEPELVRRDHHLAHEGRAGRPVQLHLIPYGQRPVVGAGSSFGLPSCFFDVERAKELNQWTTILAASRMGLPTTPAPAWWYRGRSAGSPLSTRPAWSTSRPTASSTSSRPGRHSCCSPRPRA